MVLCVVSADRKKLSVVLKLEEKNTTDWWELLLIPVNFVERSILVLLPRLGR